MSDSSRPPLPERARAGLEHLELAMKGGQLAIWELDVGSREFRWSENAREIVAWPEDRLPRSLDELMGLVPEEDRAIPLSRMERLLEGDEDVPRAEFRIDGPSGRIQWVEARGELVLSEDGRQVIMGTFHNISERKQAQLELEESEERLRLALAASGVGTWEFRVAADVVLWSPETHGIFGTTPTTFGGTLAAFLGLIHPDDRDAVRTEVESALAGRDHFEVEHRIIHPELGVRWLRGSGDIQRDDTGTVRRLVGTVMDLTDEVRTRTELEAQKTMLARQARVLEQTQAAAQVGGFERNLETGEAWWTDQMYRLRGLDPRRFDPSTDDVWGGVSDTARRTLKNAIRRVRNRGEGQEVIVPMDHPTRGKRWVRVAFEPMQTTASSEVTGYYGALTDITRRKREQDLLVRVARSVSTGTGERFLQSVVRDLVETFEAQEGFVGLLEDDPDDPAPPQIRTVARYSTVGPAPEVVYPVAGTPCEAVVAGEVKVHHQGVCRLFPEDQMLREMGCESYAGAPIRSGGGDVIGLLGVFSPFPQPFPASAMALLRIFAARTGAEMERMAAEEALAQKEQELYQSQKMEAIGKLAGGIAHDFNNLLTVINSSAEMARADLEDDEVDVDALAESLDEIRASGRRAAELTRQLLAFSRKQVLRTVELDLAEVVRGAGSLLSRLLGDQVRVTEDFGHGDVRVRADRGQLEQVLVNLAVNARDAMPGGGTLTLRTRRLDHGIASPPPPPGPGQWVRLSVVDTGTGIPQEIRSQVFDPFFTTKAPGTGTGLGLSTVYGIVRQSGGFIHLETELGAGASFHIDLPALPHPGEGPGPCDEPKTGSAAPSHPTDGLRVLVVEDDAVVRAATVELLRDRGCQVLDCGGLEDAGKVARGLPPVDVVLADRLTDGPGGPRLDRLVGRPIVLLSDFTSPADRLATASQAERAGAPVLTLARPVSAERLVRTLNAHAKAIPTSP